jgi:hypothetical protein
VPIHLTRSRFQAKEKTMAKIGANSAKEVARITAKHGIYTRLYVLTSDGRVLSRYTKPHTTNFVILYRNVSVPEHKDRQYTLLERIAARMGYQLVKA